MGFCKKKGKKADPGPATIKLWHITRFASPKTKLVYRFGFFFTVIAGIASPFISLIMGYGIQVYDPQGTDESIKSAMYDLMIMAAVVATVLWISAGLSYALMQHGAEKLAFELRAKYLVALLR